MINDRSTFETFKTQSLVIIIQKGMRIIFDGLREYIVISIWKC